MQGQERQERKVQGQLEARQALTVQGQERQEWKVQGQQEARRER